MNDYGVGRLSPGSIVDVTFSFPTDLGEQSFPKNKDIRLYQGGGGLSNLNKDVQFFS